MAKPMSQTIGSGRGGKMSAYAIERSIRVSFENLESMSIADRDIEVDFMLRSLSCSLDRTESESWWLWI